LIEVRLRFGPGRRSKFRVATEARKTALQSMARGLLRAKVDPDLAEKLVRDASQADDAEFSKLQRVAAVAAEPTSNAHAAKPKTKPGAPSETVAAYADRWFDDRERRGLSSVDHDRGRLTLHVMPILGALPIVSVSSDNLRTLVEDLDGKVLAKAIGWSTASKIWGLVTKMFSDACKSKAASLRVRRDNPATDVRGPDTGEDKAKQWLYPNEAEALLACEDVPLRWRRLYALAVYLYLRPGELAALEWRDVNFEQGYVSIHQALDIRADKIKATKTGITRKVPIHASLKPHLEALHKEANGKGRVVQNDHDNKEATHGMPPLEDLAATLRRHLKRAKVERADLHDQRPGTKVMTFYDLRATGITWEALAGTEPLAIMQRAGHKNLSTTQIYIREAETLGISAGKPFPLVPSSLLDASPTGPGSGPSSGPGGDEPAENLLDLQRPQGDSNPCYSLERAVSWAGLDDGDV